MIAITVFTFKLQAMKKMLFIIGMCIITLGLNAQDQKNLLEDQRVEPPKFKGEKIEREQVEIKKSPICCFIENELEYPEFTNVDTPEGIVVIEFTINADGNLSNFKVTNPVDYHLEQAVISCVKQTDGMWTPGKVNGQYSSMEKSVSVKFDVEGNPSFNEISKGYYFSALRKFHNGQNTIEDNLLTIKKKERKSERLFNSSLRSLDKATVYKPNDASVLFWKARNYEMLGMRTEMRETLKKRNALLSQQINGKSTIDNYDLAIINK